MNPNPVLECIRRRRVTRYFTEEPLSERDLKSVLEAGRWAPSGGNRRLHRLIVVADWVGVDLVRSVSPGMLGHPAALIVICIDWQRVDLLGAKRHHKGAYVDVGTAAENMLLAAEALGLGAGPVTSFSKEAAREILGLPVSLQPELMVCLGKRAEVQPFDRTLPRQPIRLKDLVVWKHFSKRAEV